MYLKALLILLAASTSAMVQALPEDAHQELTIRSQQAEMDRKTGIVIYQGDVVLTQGTLTIEADRLQIRHQGNTLQSAIAEGSPARYQQQITADKPLTKAEGKRIEYLSQQKEVIVSGNARLLQGGDQFSGERLTYDMSKETVKADGGASTTAQGEEKTDNSRIRMVIQPQNNPAAGDSSGALTEPATDSTKTEAGDTQ